MYVFPMMYRWRPWFRNVLFIRATMLKFVACFWCKMGMRKC